MKSGSPKSLVYFARMRDGTVKIGATSSIASRISQLRADLLHTIEGSVFRECAVHFLLRKSNLKGEYFNETAELLGFIDGTKRGNYSGLIDDLPRVTPWRRPNPYPNKWKQTKCYKLTREALGLSIEQVASETGLQLSTVISSDSQTAPDLLSGRMVQYMVGKAAERGGIINSHHFTGLYDQDLRAILSEALSQEVAA